MEQTKKVKMYQRQTDMQKENRYTKIHFIHKTATYKRLGVHALFPLLMGSLLVGCTPHNEDFDCPAGKGIGCQSVTEVKKKLDQGAIDIPESSIEANRRRALSSPSALAPVMVPAFANASSHTKDMTPISFVDSSGMVIERTPEKPLRVWLAPYQDSDGNLREASVVHTVVQGGVWQLRAQ
jgi:type IV conjugative transfer system lipoprotein TraV